MKLFWMALMVVACIVLMVFVVLSGGALAQQPMCGDYDKVVAVIMGPKWGEVPVSEGTVGEKEDGPIIQTFANPKTRTWSQILIPKPGMACFLPGGINFGQAKLLSLPPRPVL